ncbi:unnamed protein product [Fusarium equiseti]|uniref:Translation initiation factor beta propellor-like domain-containing protein n=1 Tax=Fusarium equiseti TaxID=61235 RepID=A0A8J2JE39_FUSEQ|nr:unnamed protein product [Fusarium equiseti]
MSARILAHKEWKEVFFSPDGRYLALLPFEGRGQVEIVDRTALETEMTCECSDISYMEFSPDGQAIVIFYLQNGSLEGVCEVWSLPRKEQIYRSSVSIYDTLQGDWTGVSFSPDCRFIALIAARHEDEALDEWKLLDLTTGVKGTIQGQESFNPVFHPQSHLLAISREFYVDVRETPSLVSRGRFAIDRKDAWDFDGCNMAFSATGSFVCTSGNYNNETTVEQWDIASGRWYVAGGDINHLFFSDDKYLVCDQGRLPLPQSRPWRDKNCNTEHADSQDLLYVGDEWLYRGLERLLWLPLPYQSRISRIQGNTLALSHEDGNIRIIRFDLAVIPVGPDRSKPLGVKPKDWKLRPRVRR